MQILLARRSGRGAGRLFNWFFRILIWNMIIGGLANILDVSRMVAFFILLGIILAITLVGFILRRRMAS